MTRGLPPHKCKRKWMTLCWTTTSQVTSSACARTSSIIDIVNSIRLAKGKVFAEWKKSETAKLFEDHGYKNKKQAGGYFLHKSPAGPLLITTGRRAKLHIYFKIYNSSVSFFQKIIFLPYKSKIFICSTWHWIFLKEIITEPQVHLFVVF